MTKNIVIALLALLTLTSFSFAYYQRTLTDRALVVAEANAELAHKAEREALAQRQLAQQQMAIAQAEAERAQLVAVELMKKLGKK